MNRRLGLCIGLATLLAGSVAFAQEEVTIGYAGLPYKSTGEANTGIQVSESVLLHTGLGVEAGYDTNVFYQPSNTIGSAIIRVVPFAELTNATKAGPTGRVTFDLRASLQYRRYQSDNPAVEPFKNTWMPQAGISVGSGAGEFGYTVANVYSRIEDAPYSPDALPILRNNNQAALEARWSPGGGRLTGTIRYTNMLDQYANDYAYATSDLNQLMLDVAWKWLPKTAFFGNVSAGYIFYLNDQADAVGKSSSFPLRVTVGLRGLITEKTAVTVAAGYGNGFYTSGASTQGFLGSTYLNASVATRPTMLSRVVLGFTHDFENSVISNYYYSETVYASFVQQVARRFALDLSGRYSYQNYQGILSNQGYTGRTDNIFQIGLSGDYFLRNWAYVGFGYALVANSGSLEGVSLQLGAAPSVDYLKQQFFGRIGVSY